MTKNDKREFDIARQLAENGGRDVAARVIATVHRSARSKATQAAALALILELNLADCVTMMNGCLLTNN